MFHRINKLTSLQQQVSIQSNRKYLKYNPPHRVPSQSLVTTCLFSDDCFSSQQKQIHWAIRQGYATVLQLTTMHMSNQDWVEPRNLQQHEIAPMDLALSLGKDEIVCYLLDKQASVDRFFLGMTRLYLAVLFCQDETVIKMLSRTSRVDCPNGSKIVDQEKMTYEQISNHFIYYPSGTPLHASIHRSTSIISHKLLQSGHPVDVFLPINGKTALMLAAQHRKTEWVQLFLQYGASTTTTSKQGYSAAHYAVLGGSLPCLQLIAEKSPRTIWKDPQLLALATRHNDLHLAHWIYRQNPTIDLDLFVQSAIRYQAIDVLRWYFEHVQHPLKDLEIYRLQAQSVCLAFDRRISEFKDLSYSTRAFYIYTMIENYLKR